MSTSNNNAVATAASRRGRARRRLLVASVVMPLGLASIAIATVSTAQASTCPANKTFTLDFSPGTVLSNSSTTFTGTLYNCAIGTTQNVGSFNISPQASSPTFTITGPNTKETVGAGYVQNVNGVLQGRNLSIAPGQTVTFTFTATAPSVQGNYTWVVIAKQANNFNGTNNDVSVVTPPTTTVNYPSYGTGTGSGTGGTCPNSGCSFSSGTPGPNDTDATVTIPAYTGPTFTYHYLLAAGGFCGLACTGDAANLGTLPPGFPNAAGQPIVLDLLYGSNVNGLVAGATLTAAAFKCVPSSTNNCGAAGSIGTPLLPCLTPGQLNLGGQDCVNGDSVDPNTGIRDVQVLLSSADPWVGNIYLP